MIIAGITGGIGSGKTMVCKEWEKLGATIYYADDEAKKLMVTDSDVRNKLRETFGDSVYQDDGSLNKQYLIAEAFEKNRVEELNKIVHPAVALHFKKVCEQAQKAGKDIIVKEAALLLNYGRPDGMNVVVIVLSDENKRIKRVMERDRVPEAKVRERVNKQSDFEELLPLADFVIYNNKSVDELRKKSKEIYMLIKKMANQKNDY